MFKQGTGLLQSFAPENPTFEVGGQDALPDVGGKVLPAGELDLLELPSGMPDSPATAASWWSSWGTSLVVHAAVLGTCWIGLRAEVVQRITMSGSRLVLSAQFSESVPTPLMDVPVVELELPVEDFIEPAEPVCEPEPIPEIPVELPALKIAPKPPVAKPVEQSSQLTEAAQESTPTEVGLDPLEPAELLHNEPPEYPSEAIAKGWTGLVLLRLHITALGKVSEVDLVESSGHPMLDEAAIAAVRKWEFHPACRKSVPVESMAELPIRFMPR